MPTVGDAKLMWNGPPSDATVSDNFRTMSFAPRQMYSIVTSFDATDLDVYKAPGLPYPGQPYPGTDYVIARKANLQRVSPIYWVATVDYEGQIAGFNPDGSPKSPIDAPPKIDFGSVVSEQDCDEDIDGNPIVTACNEALPGARRMLVDQTVVIKRNMLTFDTYLQSVYMESVNSDWFLGWPPGTAKLMQLRASNVIDKDFGYWEVTGEIHFRKPYRTTPEKAWYARLYHKGYLKKVPLIPEPGRFEIVRATDEDKGDSPVSVGLNEDGTQRTDTDPPFWKEFKLYQPLPYAALGLI